MNHGAEIIQNLKDVYADSITLSHQKMGAFSDVEWFMSPKGFWPSAMVGVVEPEEMPSIIEKAEAGLLPPFFIADRADSLTIKTLELNGFYEVKRWMGMYMEKPDLVPFVSSYENVIIKEVCDRDGLSCWSELVYKELLKHSKVDHRVYDGWLNNENYSVLGAYVGDQLVSAGLAFLKQSQAGIYFISTDSDFRGKGIGSNLVSRLLEKSFEKGVERIYLQASIKAETLYQRLGFKSVNSISVYWKMGIV